jgi:hypothetical protein
MIVRRRRGRRDHFDATTAPIPIPRVRVRLHEDTTRGSAPTAAGRDGSALLWMWICARWRARCGP